MPEHGSTTDVEIKELIINNNCDEIIELFEEAGLQEYTVNPTTTANHFLATIVLNFASVCALKETLSPEMAKIIIARTASSVHIFDFLRTLVLYCDIDISHPDAEVLPRELVYDLKNNKMNGSVTDRILALDEEEFNNLVALILNGNVNSLHKGFSIPVMHYLYYSNVIPLDSLLVYMATNLEQPSTPFLEELSRGIFGMFF